MISKAFAEHTANNRNDKRILLWVSLLPLALLALALGKYGPGMEFGFVVAANMSPSIATAAVLIGAGLAMRKGGNGVGDRALTWAAKAMATTATLPAAAAIYLAWQAGLGNPAAAAAMSGEYAIGVILGAVATHGVAGVLTTAPIYVALLFLRRRWPALLAAIKGGK